MLPDPYSDHVEIVWGQGARAEARREDRPVATEWPLRRELEVFRDHLVGGPPPPTDGEQGRLVVDRVARLRTLAGLSPSGAQIES